MRRLRRDKNLVRVARKVRNKRDGRIVLANDATAVFFLRANHIPKQHASRFREMTLTRARFSLDSFEDEVGRVDLAVWMRVGNAHRLALVFKDKHVLDLVQRAQLAILFLPHAEQVLDRSRLELRERETVIGTVTNYARDSSRRSIAINARRRLQCLRSVEADARMIVVKNKSAGVVVVARAADAKVAGTEIAISYVFRQQLFVVLDRLTAPRAVLPVSGDDDPLLA